MKDEPGFKTALGKGFRLTFDNGWGVSVQWGTRNYCANRNPNSDDMDGANGSASATAEIMYLRDGVLVGEAIGWQTATEVLRHLVSAASGTVEIATEHETDVGDTATAGETDD